MCIWDSFGQVLGLHVTHRGIEVNPYKIHTLATVESLGTKKEV